MRILFFLLACLLGLSHGLRRSALYPYGELHGDKVLAIGDDISSNEIQLQTLITFYESHFSSIFINVNGLLSFETDMPVYKSDVILPTRQLKLIAPFHADVDTRMSGNVYYRETQDPAMLGKIETFIQERFPDYPTFWPRSMLIVTWDEVGHYDSQYDQTNTFQVLIASNGNDSFVSFLYPEDGINWISGEGKHGRQHQQSRRRHHNGLYDKRGPAGPDSPAQVGFDAGYDRYARPGEDRSYMLPHSGLEKIADIASGSNTDIEGYYIFHVGNTRRGSSIGLPDSGNRVVVNDIGANARSCLEGGRDTCDENARCEDYPGGFCCHCQEGYFGNGRKCIQPDVAQRVSGKVSGNINNVAINDEELHVYVVTKDGRVYTAISKIAQDIGFSMQSLYPIGGVLGWLFAAVTSPKAHNGFSVTGGDLNRTATIRYASGEVVEIKQTVVGSDGEGYMRMNTEVTGRVPTIPSNAVFGVDGTKEEYRRVRAGLIQSTATHTYTVDERPHKFTVDQAITYKECAFKPLDGFDVQRLVISRPMMKYQDVEEIVRYATTNKMAPAVGGDPCKEIDMECDTNADCKLIQGSHRCMCKQGFYGDGLVGRCQDENECALNSHDCDYNAECINSAGSFSCRCNQGYSGDGKTCTQENELQCNVINNCGANARCVYNERSFGYVCQCVDGYRGDGFVCDPEPCDIANNCDGNARCQYSDLTRQYQCVCNPGFAGDGYRCDQADCTVVDNCDRNAECIYDSYEQRHVCRCDEGYEGDGTYCRETVVDCNTINNCHMNAECLYDRTTGNYQCQCLPGYGGDGFSCRVTDCRRDSSMCDPNASCLPRDRENVCECNPGYEGDGFTCKASGVPGLSGGMLMMARGMNIMDMPIRPTDNNRGKPTIYIPGQTAIGVDVDCYARFFYWTDVSGKTISKARLDGTDSQVVVSGLGSPEGVAVDWIARNMYWTDSGLDRIEASKLDGTNRKMLFDTDLINPRGIAVDPSMGYLFWTDWNRNAPKIERSNMDGTERKVLVETDLGLPNGLTLDYEQQRVCWADADTHKIECIDYSGRNRRQVYDQAGWAFDLVYANNVFYWTDWDQKNVLLNVNEYGGVPNSPLDLPPGGNGRVYGITLAREQCPAGNNACSLNNGGCRFLCLPTPNGGRSCACPDDIEEEECNRIGLLLRK